MSGGELCELKNPWMRGGRERALMTLQGREGRVMPRSKATDERLRKSALFTSYILFTCPAAVA